MEADGMHMRVLKKLAPVTVSLLSIDFDRLWWLGRSLVDRRKRQMSYLSSRRLRKDPGNYKLSSITSASWKIFASWKPFLSSWSARKWLEIGNMNLPRASCPWSTWLVDHGKMTGSLDKGRVVNIVYLDFSKAFHKVFNSILPVKIGRYGQVKQMIR